MSDEAHASDERRVPLYNLVRCLDVFLDEFYEPDEVGLGVFVNELACERVEYAFLLS